MRCSESVRYALALVAFIWLVPNLARASASAPMQEPAPPSLTTADPDSLILVVGCIKNERAFRKATEAPTGGFAGTGIGMGNEFVLMNASLSNGLLALTGPSTLAGAAAVAGVAYQLTGPREGAARRYVGHRVEIHGTLKPGDGSGLRELQVGTYHFAAGICPVN